MKKIYLLTAAALALASCTNDEFLGENGNDPNSVAQSNATISFSSASKNITRANIEGKDAAKKLNNKFVVYGWKTNTSEFGENAGDHEDVYQDYLVTWSENSANTTESNTSNWEYVGNLSQPIVGEQVVQSIKYWDYSTYRYDFIGWSISDGNAVLKERKTVSSETTAPSLKFYAPTAKDLAKIYVSDKYTATPDAAIAKNHANEDVLENSKAIVHGKYQDAAKLQFRSLASKVRVGIYETVPGYTVSNVVFYNAENAKGGADVNYKNTWTDNTVDYVSDQSHATLYTANAAFGRKGEITVKYHDATYETGDLKMDNTAYAENKAEKTTFFAFGQLTNTKGNGPKTAVNDKEEIGTESTTATMSIGNDDNYIYTYVFPMEDNTEPLQLKVNYILTSTDGSGETIKVTGANATVPATYAKWMANYAYTYIFKISDNTNGQTGQGDPAGLYPITFDACVVDDEEGNQETITTVSDNSITTYQFGSKVLENSEYKAGGTNATIYVVEEGANTTLANTKLYVAEAFNGATITEAALKNKKLLNGVALVNITNGNLTEATEIPSIDVPYNLGLTCVKFEPLEGYTYVIEHKIADGKYDYKVIKVTGNNTPVAYKISSSTVNEGETVDLTVTGAYNGDNYPVTGAAGAFTISNAHLTAKETATEGTYTFTAASGIPNGDVTVNVGSNASNTEGKVTVSAYSFVAPATVATGSKTGTVQLNIGTSAAASKTLAIKNAAGAAASSDEIVLTYDTDKYKINAKKAGSYTVSHLGAETTITVVPYTLTFTDKFVNVGNATEVILANGAVATADLNVTLATATGSVDATALAATDGVANVVPGAAGKLIVKYEDAEASITVMNFVLTGLYTTKACDVNATPVASGTYYIKLLNGTTEVNGANFVTSDQVTVTPTSTAGVYMVKTSAAFTTSGTPNSIVYKYQGVEMQKLTF